MFVATSAKADNAGVWTKLDLKIPVHEFDNGMNLKVRLTPEFAFTDDAGGLKQTAVRVGPTFKFNKWFDLTVNGVSADTGIKHDVRPEVQPEFTVKVGDFVLKDRNRLSYRALDNAAGDRWQYTNEPKIVYNIPSTEFSTFASYEGFLDFQTEKLNQHRLTMGAGYNLDKNWHADLGYMYRTTLAAPSWVKDNFLFIAINTR